MIPTFDGGAWGGIVAIAAGLVLAPVIAIMFVAVAIDTYTFVRGWLAARGSCL